MYHGHDKSDTCTYLFKLVANELECLIDGIRMSCDGNNSLWAGSVANIDLGPALQNVEKEWMIRQNSSRSARARI